MGVMDLVMLIEIMVLKVNFIFGCAVSASGTNMYVIVLSCLSLIK
jgi:hypothetical protein